MDFRRGRWILMGGAVKISTALPYGNGRGVLRAKKSVFKRVIKGGLPGLLIFFAEKR